ncbi:putative NRPS-like enzyme [Xylariales sp. PMI_506]|nr:putative NRPS-like enzyme [Xylariales sp. PMI_506]
MAAPSTFDQLLRQRAADPDQASLLAFPRERYGTTDYELISGSLLNSFVDGAAKALMEKGFSPQTAETVVGVCAPTDLDYLVTIFGFIRLGYVPFLLSPRLPPTAVKALLAQNTSGTLFYSRDHKAFRVDDESLHGLNTQQILQRGEYDDARHGETTEFRRDDADDAKESQRRCLLLHSSGSTGLPKTIEIDNQKIMAAGAYAQDAVAFITAPFSHSFGMLSYMQAIHKRKTIYAMSGYVPQTHDNITAAIKAASPEIIWTVPYALKLLTEKPDGVEAIKNCRFVSSAGSKLPDEIGDLLTEAGVHVGMQFGSTETGLILSSAYRPPGDKAWDYLRPPPHVLPFIQFRPVDGEKHECIILDGHKGKTMSNSDDPPKSWHTNDLFVKHPSIPNAWKFVGRMDDRITLLNGEKVLPLAIEGSIRQHPLVREAVVFGIDREVPGVLVFRALGTSQMSDTEFLEHVWPAIEGANSRSEAFAQISKEMVIILGDEVDCPTTDKSSIKRGQIYREFAGVIDTVYADNQSRGKTESLRFSVLELENWILARMSEMGHDMENAQANFFSAGVDSLKAVQLRTKIIKHIDLGGRDSECTSMIVFECSTPAGLAKKLYATREGVQESIEDGYPEELMIKMVKKYSDFSQYSPSEALSSETLRNGSVVIVTGATGFLGNHILAALVASSNVSQIYCLVRPRSDCELPPAARLKTVLRERGFELPDDKLTCIEADLTVDNFGLDGLLFTTLLHKVTHVIHCAWTVNFAVSLATFEPQVHALHALLAFGRRSSQQAHLLFCSSVGVAYSTNPVSFIASDIIALTSDVPATGYAQSKLVAEHVVEAAVTREGVKATILRIGQIVPGRDRGTKLWNPDEAIPLMIRSACKVAAGCLPMMSDARDECDWIHADVLADTILDIAGLRSHATSEHQLVYNIVNPQSFSWRGDLLPALQAAGLGGADIVPWDAWLQKLRESSDDVKVNPSRKLLDFWSRQPQGTAAVTRFDTAAAQQISPALGVAPRAVDGPFVEQLVQAWKSAGAL